MKKTDTADIVVIIILLVIGSAIGYGIARSTEPRDTTPVIDLRKSDSLLTPTPDYYPYD